MLFKAIDKFIEAALFLSILGMVLIVSLQIFARFFLESAPPWTEEGSRVFFVFSIAFGAGLAVRDHVYVALDSLLNVLKVKSQKILKVGIMIFVLLIMMITLIYSIDFIKIGHSETSPALNIRMSMVFSSIFILSILVIYYTLIELVKYILKQKSSKT